MTATDTSSPLQDHHCPWLNQCVGLGNERYFVLFMSWLCFACVIVVGSGWQVTYAAVRLNEPVSEGYPDVCRGLALTRHLPLTHQWHHPYTPRLCVLLTFALAAAMALGLGVMAFWQLILVAHGETSVESHDNAHYDTLARRKGQKFTNVYDLGPKRNLELFFNVGEDSRQ